MELVLKIYNDKPARIGILFESEFKASKQYEAIIEAHKGETFRIKIEVIKDKVNLLLVSNQNASKFEYKDLQYKLDQLKKFQAFVKQEAQIQFVHVYGNYHDSLQIAKPNRSEKMEFVIITHYDISTPDEL